ncbi:MAG TPA: potassium-transporting ATPase subunit KdpA [Acidimicrobiales bacterium]|nr:potassium-transporting ATPase subunit KdpA [Acidimicrobiales bacterium]
MDFLWTIVALAVVLGLAWRFLGSYLAAVYEGRVAFLGWLERPIYRALRVDPEVEQSWQRYAASVVLFSGVAILLTYLVERLQGSLPLDPQHLGAVAPALSWNTAVSFVTNTNWQNYAGETTMSYLTQMAALTVQQFASAAVGMAVAIALVRGFARRGSPTIGNFWVDVVQGTIYVLVPIAFVAGLVFVAQGAVQTLAGPVTVHNPLTGSTQVVPRGPVGFMEAIKELGTNGGGFFNANGAHPFEDPTAATLFLSVVLILAIPVALTYTFGRMVGRGASGTRQAGALLAAMAILFGGCLAVTSYAESQPNPAVNAAHVVSQPEGNMVGKEVRFGVLPTTLYNVAATQTSTGSVSGANDSFTPIGGLGVLTGMLLGEVSPGGVGSGLYTILLFAIVAVFLGGLMVGRTPEYLGKKIQAKEVKLAALGVLVMPLVVIVMTGIAVSLHAGRAAVGNGGPHGFTEILYAFTSQANNNGSAFAGLSGNTDFYNVLGGVAMLLGRFAIAVPVLALAGALAAKNVVPAGLGTFRTDTPLFTGLLVGVIVIVGGLTFFPAVSLGPVVEQLLHGRLFS